MSYSLTKANLAMLFNRLGTLGITISAELVTETNKHGEEFKAASGSTVEAYLATVDFMPVIRLVADLDTNEVWIATSAEKIKVISFFDNGSGPYFRDENGAEFCGVQRDGYVHWFAQNQPKMKFQTEAGRIREEADTRITALNEEIKALKAEISPETELVSVI
jgi:hypothetical protein